MGAGSGSMSRNNRRGSSARGPVRRLVSVTSAIAIAIGLVSSAIAPGAFADTSTATNVAYTCTTNGFGNQPATYSATITDTIDPAAVGNSVTYRFVVPFAQDPPPVTATYRGGTTSYRIPAGLMVTSVSAPPKAGSNLTATASIQGDSVVITNTGSQPIDGGTYPTPDLVVTGTITSAAAGPGVVWRTPYQIVANVDAQFVGRVVATCAPNDPSTVIATTTVPAGPQTPVAKNQTVAVGQGMAKSITLSATDADNTPAQLTFAVATPPAHGVLTGVAPALSYTSDATYAGVDSFTFTATDPGGLTGTGTVTINVFRNNVIDNTPPVVTISSPQNGSVFAPGQVVNASFLCSDSTTAVEACTGSVVNGAPISTTIGAHIFTVDARDTAGNSARTTAGYRVVDPALAAQSYNAGNAIPVTCNPNPPLGNPPLPATVYAPIQVGTGRSLTMRFAPGEASVPALMTRTNVIFTLAIPANGTAISASLVQGTGTANARSAASVTVTAGKAELNIAGPIDGGTTAATTYTPPAVDVVIRAGTTPNVDVQTQLSQYTETDALTGVGQVPLTRTCNGGNPSGGQPNPVLTRTTVIDTTPPTIALVGPINGGLFGLNAAVPAQFACADETSLAACAATTANGASLDTRTPGVKTLIVIAVDAAGNVAQKLVSVRIVTVAFTTRFQRDELPLLDRAAAYYGTDRTGVARLGAQLLQYLLAIAGPPAQPFTPPANTGPVAVTPVYPAADAQRLASSADQVGLTGDQFQRLGTSLVIYLYAISR